MIDYHYFFLIGSVLVAAVSQVLLKKGALHHYDSWIREYLNPWVITGYILMFGSVFLSIMGLRGVDFFNAPVIDSLGYVLVPVCGAVFFHEKLTARKLVGICCIVLGMTVFYLCGQLQPFCIIVGAAHICGAGGKLRRITQTVTEGTSVCRGEIDIFQIGNLEFI